MPAHTCPWTQAWQRFACTKMCCGVLFWGWSQRLSLDQESVWNNKRSGTVEGLGKLRVWFSWGSGTVEGLEQLKVWISWGFGSAEGLDQLRVYISSSSGTVEGLDQLRVWKSWGFGSVEGLDQSRVWISRRFGSVEGLDVWPPRPQRPCHSPPPSTACFNCSSENLFKGSGSRRTCGTPRPLCARGNQPERNLSSVTKVWRQAVHLQKHSEAFTYFSRTARSD